MISNTAIQDFEAACESVRFDAERATHQGCMKVGGQSPPGHSRRPIMMDAAAAEVFEAHAQHLHWLLGQLNAADPATDVEARRQQLGELIDGQLRKLGHVVEGALREQVGLPMMALTNPFLPTQLHASVASAVRKYRGQLGLSAASAAASMRAQTSVQNVNVTNHGSIANLQTGHGNTATVTQTIVTQVTPGEVKAALDALIQALQQAQGVAPDQQVEVVEVLEQVKAEADKEKPNKVKLDGLIGGTRKVLEGLKVGLDLFKTVEDWYALISANAVVVAPVIGQVVQQLMR